MSPPDDTPEAPAEEGVAATVAKAARSSTLPKIIVVVCGVVALLLAGVLATTRYGVLLPQGRLLLEARASGLKIGRYGRLKVEGLQGDIWRDFTVRRLIIVDEKGVWLEARNLAIQWDYLDLFRRRFHADRIAAEQVRVLRRPTLTPKSVSRGMPISIDIDELQARLELLPAFSYRRGLYDVAGSLDVQRRNGGQKGQIAASSLLHRGDNLYVQFDIGKTRPLLVIASAREAEGGALAGSLGLPADRPFALQVRADGSETGGRFTAKAEVGDTRPLDATGAWNPQGGQAQGVLLLTASRLTEGLAQRFGPEARFAVTGRKAEGPLYDLDARVTSANLTAHAVGRADVGKRRTGPAGLAVDLRAGVLSKITGGPQMGDARVRGVLSGELDDLTFKGNAIVARLQTGGYSLQTLSGPVEMSRRKGVLTVSGRAAGQGGAGQGALAAVLGGKPSAAFDISRLADGRFLFREIEATGAGLKVSAEGSRTLLGGLNFKGKAAVSNLASARAGASGALNAKWTAVQGGGGKPWTLGVDAAGERLALGFSELDRLLGPSPRLQARGAVEGAKVSLGSLKLNGAAIDVTGAGVLGADRALAFKLDWSATGPFRAGPVEVTGRAKGAGALTGDLASPRADLTAELESLDIPRLPLKAARLTLSFLRRPDGSSGLFALTGTSDYGPAVAKAAFRFPQGGVDLSEVAVDAGGVKASGAISLRRGSPSSADLDILVGKGAFLAGGQVAGDVRIVDAAGGPRATLNLAAKSAVLPGARFAIGGARLTADGPLSRLPYSIQAAGASSEGRWLLSGRGTVAQQQPGYLIGFDGEGRFGERDLRTLETATFRFVGPEKTARLRLAASDGGQIALDAQLARQDAQVRAQLTRLGLGVVNEDLAGRIDATLTLNGRGGQLDGVLDAKLDDARGRGADVSQGLDGSLNARLSGDSLALQAAVTNTQGLRANADVVLPAEASAAPFRVAINRQRPIRGRVFAEGEVKPLWDLLVGGERELAGRVRLEGTLGGTLADPNAVGQAQVDGGRFTDGATGLKLADVVIRASLNDDRIDVTQATGADGSGGSLSGAGRINLARNGASTFRLDLKNFRLIDNDQATASATGQATLDRNAQGQVRLVGNLAIDKAEVSADRTASTPGVVYMEVVERNKPVDVTTALQAPRRRGPAVALDVTLTAPRRVFVRGRGLDVELSLDAHVGGDTSRPALSGAARVVRGEYQFAGKRFEFDDRGVVYLATSPEAIRLDLAATRDDPSLTAVVRIRGTAAKPEISLTSTPVLPNDEVLSQVLFGRSASQLSPLEAAQLASALSALAGGGGFDVIGNLRNFAGLDRLALGGGDESGVTVSGGKYLTDDVYLELTGGGREGPSAQVEWRLGRNLSIISKLAGQGDGRLAVRWRKDY